MGSVGAVEAGGAVVGVAGALAGLSGSVAAVGGGWGVGEGWAGGGGEGGGGWGGGGEFAHGGASCWGVTQGPRRRELEGHRGPWQGFYAVVSPGADFPSWAHRR